MLETRKDLWKLHRAINWNSEASSKDFVKGVKPIAAFGLSLTEKFWLIPFPYSKSRDIGWWQKLSGCSWIGNQTKYNVYSGQILFLIMFPIREIKRLDFIKENSKAENINNIDMTETEDKELAENLNLCFLWHVLSVLLCCQNTVLWDMRQSKILESWTKTKKRSSFLSIIV